MSNGDPRRGECARRRRGQQRGDPAGHGESVVGTKHNVGLPPSRHSLARRRTFGRHEKSPWAVGSQQVAGRELELQCPARLDVQPCPVPHNWASRIGLLSVRGCSVTFVRQPGRRCLVWWPSMQCGDVEVEWSEAVSYTLMGGGEVTVGVDRSLGDRPELAKASLSAAHGRQETPSTPQREASCMPLTMTATKDIAQRKYNNVSLLVINIESTINKSPASTGCLGYKVG